VIRIRIARWVFCSPHGCTQRTINSSRFADITVTILVIAMAAMTGAAAVGVDITNPSGAKTNGYVIR
jgi:hypothetical protein